MRHERGIAQAAGYTRSMAKRRSNSLPVIGVLIVLGILIAVIFRNAGPSSSEGEITPAELVKILQDPAAPHPLLLQIGFRVMYLQAHIPNSEFIGPTDDPAALEALRARVSPLPRDTFIVLYCGCCPWERCPNVAPAMKAMAAMGFTNAKVLYMATDFGTDWVAKGYPVQSGG
jgi:thiosulfate/3-mercaptopyruvate sulfurtransferase